MVDGSSPLVGRNGADVGQAPVKASVARDIETVQTALREIWVEDVIDYWLAGRNSFLDGARPIDVLDANQLPRVMDAVREEIQGGYR